MFARKLFCFAAAFALSLIAVTVSAEDCSNNRSWIPPGSTTWHPAPNVLAWRPPTGYSLVAADGRFVGSASHTCDCSNETGGCNPQVAPNGHTSCDDTNCSGGCSGFRGAIAIRDTGSAVTFASRQRAHNMPQALPELMALPFVRAEIAAFLQVHNGSTPPPAPTFVNNHVRAPAGYVYSLLDVRGYLVPALINELSPGLAGGVAAIDIDCKCKKNQAGCDKKSGSLGVLYCDAGECKSCKLTTIEKLSDGAIIETEWGF